MINVNETLLDAIVTQVDEMRFHANNDPKCWKKIIYLALLDDMYDWSFYRDDSIQIQSKLKELRTNFILNNPMFKIFSVPNIKTYTNANVPLNNDTWREIWDNEDVYEINLVTKTSDGKIELGYDPDYSCKRQLVYLPYLDKIRIDVDTNKPIVDKHLTICEKMNIYLDPETNKAYYLDTTGTWQLLNTNSDLREQDVIKLIEEYQNKGVAVKFEGESESYLTFDTPGDEEDPKGRVQVLDADDTDAINKMF